MLTIKDLEHVLTHVEWEELRNQNIFITGGTGWFGRWIVETLLYANRKLELNCRIVVLTHSKWLSNDPNVSFWHGDINNTEFPKGEFQYVIHLVPEGIGRILSFAKTHGTKKFLFTSSGAVYKLKPDDYAQQKIYDEYWCRSLGCSIDVKIARCFSFVGPYMPLDKNFAIGNFIGDAINKGKVFIHNANDTPIRTYLYMADLAIWLWTILFNGKSGVSYNVGGETLYCVKDVGNLVAKVANVPVKYIYDKMIGNDYVPYVTHTMETLGLQEWIPLDDAISRTLEFYAKR
jgi:nucleoside-diphosphate-sugar epimerase